MLLFFFLKLTIFPFISIAAAHQWLQFDVGPPSLVTGAVTRGRGDSRRRQWVTRYLISYSNDTSVWYFYKDASHLDIKVCLSLLLSDD